MSEKDTDVDIVIDNTARAWVEWATAHPFRSVYDAAAIRAIMTGVFEIEIPAVLRSTDPGQP